MPAAPHAPVSSVEVHRLHTSATHAAAEPAAAAAAADPSNLTLLAALLRAHARLGRSALGENLLALMLKAEVGPPMDPRKDAVLPASDWWRCGA